MRGSDNSSGSLFSYVDLEERVPVNHPLRVIRALVNDVLVSLDAEFERLYEGTGRQSIAPERLLRASLLQAFYSVRSERQLSHRKRKLVEEKANGVGRHRLAVNCEGSRQPSQFLRLKETFPLFLPVLLDSRRRIPGAPFPADR